MQGNQYVGVWTVRKCEMLKRETQKVEMLRGQYALLQQAWSENAMLFHDMDNHLQTIYHLACDGKCREIQDYITRISKPAQQRASILWTGVGIVDAVLNAKKCLAQEQGCLLDIDAQLPANTGIADDDFCAILTNLIDNAIEAVERKQNRPGEGECITINVSIRQINHFVMISVVNPCETTAGKKPGALFTSKPDKWRHGWGLRSVRQAVQKYNGSLSCEVTEGKFIATAILFMHRPVQV